MQRGSTIPRAACRFLALWALATSSAGLAPLWAADTSGLARSHFTQVEMGMQFKLLLYSAGQDAANRAAAAAFDRIHQLNGIMSDYDPDSELSP